MFLNSQDGQDASTDGSLALAVVAGKNGGPENARVAFVQWVLPLRTCRVADLDELNRVKMIVPVGPKQHPIDVVETILPRTGIFLSKVKRRERPTMPDIQIKLARIYEAFQMPKNTDHVEQEYQLPCTFCKLKELEEDNTVVVTHQCSVCLCTAHDACTRKTMSSPAFQLAVQSGIFDFAVALPSSSSASTASGAGPSAQQVLQRRFLDMQRHRAPGAGIWQEQIRSLSLRLTGTCPTKLAVTSCSHSLHFTTT